MHVTTPVPAGYARVTIECKFSTAAHHWQRDAVRLARCDWGKVLHGRQLGGGGAAVVAGGGGVPLVIGRHSGQRPAVAADQAADAAIQPPPHALQDAAAAARLGANAVGLPGKRSRHMTPSRQPSIAGEGGRTQVSRRTAASVLQLRGTRRRLGARGDEVRQ